MIQKCSIIKVLEVFFIEPTTIHFIRGISKEIGLAPTSVKNHINELLRQELIVVKKSKPFNGYIANRENDNFIFYKKVYNLFSLKGLTDFLVSSYYPKLIVLYGSYSLGEDIEDSDIDLFTLTKTKTEKNPEKFEKKLKRKIHLFSAYSLDKLDKNLLKKVYNGIVLYGSF